MKITKLQLNFKPTTLERQKLVSDFAFEKLNFHVEKNWFKISYKYSSANNISSLHTQHF